MANPWHANGHKSKTRH